MQKVDQRVKFPELEVQLMAKWKEENTFQKSLELREGRPRFVFYEGPPTANGMPATHHILARSFKDLFGRYKTMKGFYVERKAGWDTHGLPVELEVEKALNISGKLDIEKKIGVERFNQLCRESVYKYVDQWVAFSERMAFWQDYEHAYWTLDNEYIQSVWWALNQMWEQNLIYKGFRVAPYCPRCATPLSSHELSLGYRDNVPDPSVYIRFRLTKDPTTSILAWTTTPWTLPGNVALAVDNDIDYVKVKQNDEFLILAEARTSVLHGDFEVVEKMKGKDLVGLTYEPLYPYLKPKGPAHTVVDADFVSTEEGTGVVHTAALYGVDDLRLCQDKGIEVEHTVDLNGRFFPFVEKFAGMSTKDANPLIQHDLKERGLLYKAETILHTYPECWRCKTSLIYYALDSWYIRTTERQIELIENNYATNWVPGHIKTGRMGDWLANNVDWAISRARYWGTPLPFWVCEKCKEQRCVSSSAELGIKEDFDLHRPYIDEVTLPCPKCGGVMRRVPEVLDVWFDSGAMPFAQRGYPRSGRELFADSFPADFITEALDQTRGWFYSLLAISTLLFHQNAYRNVICLGLVVDPKGQKASKSRGNVLDPNYLFETFGTDALRWYFFTAAAVGENYRTSAETLKETVQQFLLPLWNCYAFHANYAVVDRFDSTRPQIPLAERPVLDRWMLSRLAGLVKNVDSKLADYDVTGAARPVQGFIDDLSKWYIRRSRSRFWKSQSDTDKLAAYQTLQTVLVTLSRLLAPFTPFIADAMHRNLTGGQSAHLTDYPAVDASAFDPELEEQMARARKIVESGMAARDAAHIRVRQPLSSIAVPGEHLAHDIAAIVSDELNVKAIKFGAKDVELDTDITEDLKLEGLARELIRQYNDLRRKLDFNVDDRVLARYEADGLLATALEKHNDYIKREILGLELAPGRDDGFQGEERQIDDDRLWIGLKRS